MRAIVHLIGEPDIGAIAVDVRVVDERVPPPELTACVTESLYAIHVDAPVASFDEAISAKVVLAGPPP